jgi:hypothetical protein
LPVVNGPDATVYVINRYLRQPGGITILPTTVFAVRLAAVTVVQKVIRVILPVDPSVDVAVSNVHVRVGLVKVNAVSTNTSHIAPGVIASPAASVSM